MTFFEALVLICIVAIWFSTKEPQDLWTTIRMLRQSGIHYVVCDSFPRYDWQTVIKIENREAWLFNSHGKLLRIITVKEFEES